MNRCSICGERTCAVDVVCRERCVPRITRSMPTTWREGAFILLGMAAMSFMFDHENVAPRWLTEASLGAAWLLLAGLVWAAGRVRRWVSDRWQIVRVPPAPACRSEETR